MVSAKKMGRPVEVPGGDNDLARLRRERGWSQTQAAEAIGLTRPQVSKIERGIHPLTGAAKKMVKTLLQEEQ